MLTLTVRVFDLKHVAVVSGPGRPLGNAPCCLASRFQVLEEVRHAMLNWIGENKRRLELQSIFSRPDLFGTGIFDRSVGPI